MVNKLLTALFLLMMACAAGAQEGHPLVGTWQGTWGEGDSFLTVIMTWDGRRIHGIVNPGPDMSELEAATLDSSTWHVTLTMPVPDGAGNMADLTLDGTLDNIGSRMRTLTGTWRFQGRSGEFTLQRQGGA